jgi:hypothetical protein
VSQYAVTPVPAVQAKVTVEDVNVDPGVGLVICARAVVAVVA